MTTMETETPQNMPGAAMPSSGRMIVVMGLIGLVASIMLVATYLITQPYIDANMAAYLEQAIVEVLPTATDRQTYRIIDGAVVPDDGTMTAGVRVFAGYDSLGALQGFAVEAQGQGYADIILLIYGYSTECGCIVGMKVLDNRETPGLGDKIVKDPEFLANFDDLDVRWSSESMTTVGPLELIKKGVQAESYQIHGISGATISSQAVTDILNASNDIVLRLIHSNLDVFTKKTNGE